MRLAIQLVLLAVMMAVLSVCPARAQVRNVPPAGAQAVVRVYDIRDLIFARHDYPLDAAVNLPVTVPPVAAKHEGSPATGGMFPGRPMFPGMPLGAARGGGAEGMAAPAPMPAGDDLMSNISSLLIETVDPQSWRENGGAVGGIRSLGGMLVISQTDANHQEISNLLKALRQESAKMVTLRAHWLLLSPSDAEPLLAKKEEKAAGGAQEIDPAVLAKLPQNAPHYRAQTTCFNGQTVHIASGRGRTAIIKLDAVAGEGTSIYNPQQSIVQSGLMLQVTPMLSADGERIVVDLQSIVSDWDEPGKAIEFGSRPTTRPGASAAAASLDRLNIVTQQLRTTIQFPLNKPVLVGGMTLEPSSKSNDARQLYLVLEASAG